MFDVEEKITCQEAVLRSSVIGDFQLTQSFGQQLFEDRIEPSEEKNQISRRDDSRNGIVKGGDVTRDESSKTIARHRRSNFVGRQRVAEGTFDDADQFAVNLVDVFRVETCQLFELFRRGNRRDRR